MYDQFYKVKTLDDKAEIPSGSSGIILEINKKDGTCIVETCDEFGNLTGKNDLYSIYEIEPDF